MESLDTSGVFSEQSNHLPRTSTLLSTPGSKYSFRPPPNPTISRDAPQREINSGESSSEHRLPNSSKVMKFPNSSVFSLNFSSKEINMLPGPVMDHAANLMILDLSRNKFTEFPQEITRLSKLTTLKFESNYLKKIPNEISQLQKLETLSFAHNYILSIPKTINKLAKSLNSLNLSFNHIETIPKELTELANLKILWIQSNSFTSLPISFDGLSSLKELGLEWFKYTSPSLPMVQNDKNRTAITQLNLLCQSMMKQNKNEITFEDFIQHFSTQHENLLNMKDSLQRNILHIATLEEEIGIVRYLILNKENMINELDLDKHTPLSLAVREEKYFVAKLLLLHGADPRKGGGAFGSSLHMAVTKLQLSLARELLKHGANPNAVDCENNTPLHLLFSIYSKDAKKADEIAELLLDYGAQPNTLNGDQWAPIHLGVRRGQNECIRWVIRHNTKCKGKEEKLFDLSIRGGTDSWTPLHLSSSLGHYEMIIMLSEHGAEIMERTKTGRSAREVSTNNLVAAKMLRRVENSWMSKHLFKKHDLSDKLREFSLTSSNVHNLKNMIHSTTNISQGAQNKNYFSSKSTVQSRTIAKPPAPKVRSLVNLEDTAATLSTDTDEIIEIKETMRSIPRSPNNIQKIQIVQNYKMHILGVDAPMTLKDSMKSYSSVGGYSMSNVKPQNSHSHFLFPTDFENYIKNFDNYHEEVKKFQENILNDSDENLPERLKHLFYLRAIHLKITQTLKKMYSELMPVELFIVCEYVDDEFKKSQYMDRNTLTNIQNADLIPRMLLFIYETLDYHGKRDALLKTNIARLFQEFKYTTSKHFLQQSLHQPNLPKHLAREAKASLNFLSKFTETPKMSKQQTPAISSASKENMVSNLRNSAVTFSRPRRGTLMEKCENVEDDDAGILKETISKTIGTVPKINLEDVDRSSREILSSRVRISNRSNILSERESPRFKEIKGSPKHVRANYFNQL